MAQAAEKNKQQDKQMKWWQLSLLGVAFTIGTGYFLGSGLAIQIGGPAVLIAFLVAAIGTYFVFEVLAKMTASEPLEGSFRSYAKKAFGRWAGFSSGWVYWASELLIMGSQLSALSLFTRLWFPKIPMWTLASVYAALGLIIVLLGNKGFQRFENIFAVIKVSAIVAFIGIAGAVLMGWINFDQNPQPLPNTWGELIPTGMMGLWSCLLFAFYAFGGIEIMGIMATQLDQPKKAPMAGKIMLSVLTLIYLASLSLAMLLQPWKQLNGEKSPYLVTLTELHIPYIPNIFNGVLIIAGFSTMTASLFAITTMLVTLSKDGDAPRFLSKEKMKRPLWAIGLTAAGLVASIVFSLLMPGKIYEYVTTAAGLMLLYNWMFILVTAGKLLDLTAFGKTKQFAGIGILLLAISGSLFHHTSRPGFFISLGFIVVIAAVTLIMKHIWSKSGNDGGNQIHRASFSSGKQETKSLNGKVRAKTD
ncbi:L-asparagine transporter-like permease [Paenibacillus phyllosphaerae]|uniref:L-asparagine transporter-like permease n=1 Tax=Paenibacillus phyllosphaerae TaxID=274593 RepID=A0A7W5AYI5_9BACL|nr:amino acid permease [Paenibacillus phyllosphaerae]MBB3111108.1 L-asparagine transporter-like permease [Paenibacillus phyllosphaerae]